MDDKRCADPPYKSIYSCNNGNKVDGSTNHQKKRGERKNNSQIVCAPFKISDSKTMMCCTDTHTENDREADEHAKRQWAYVKWCKNHFNKEKAFSRDARCVCERTRYSVVEAIVANMKQIYSLLALILLQ